MVYRIVVFVLALLSLGWRGSSESSDELEAAVYYNDYLKLRSNVGGRGGAKIRRAIRPAETYLLCDQLWFERRTFESRQAGVAMKRAAESNDRCHEMTFSRDGVGPLKLDLLAATESGAESSLSSEGVELERYVTKWCVVIGDNSERCMPVRDLEQRVIGTRARILYESGQLQQAAIMYRTAARTAGEDSYDGKNYTERAGSIETELQDRQRRAHAAAIAKAKKQRIEAEKRRMREAEERERQAARQAAEEKLRNAPERALVRFFEELSGTTRSGFVSMCKAHSGRMAENGTQYVCHFTDNDRVYSAEAAFEAGARVAPTLKVGLRDGSARMLEKIIDRLSGLVRSRDGHLKYLMIMSSGSQYEVYAVSAHGFAVLQADLLQN